MGKYSTFHHTLSETKICSLNPKGRRRASPSLSCESPGFFPGLLTGKNISSCCSLFQLGIQKLASTNFPLGPYIQIGQHIKLYTTSTLNSITEFNIQSVLRCRNAHASPVKTCFVPNTMTDLAFLLQVLLSRYNAISELQRKSRVQSLLIPLSKITMKNNIT